MARDLNASLTFRAFELQGSGILQLFEVQVQASPVIYEYWTGYNATIDYFLPLTTTPQSYTPFPIVAGESETDDGSKVPAMQIHVGAVDQQIVAYIESNDALRRNRVRTVFVPYDEITNASACMVDTMYVDGAFIDHEKEIATFELTSKGAVANITVPTEAIRRDQCSAIYKNASTCGYAGAETSCRRTKDACASKSNVINFKGFPGIGTKRVILA
uniref:Putative tail protein n=1 Tax=viral metagenome TaxID=1070528 RepID=A0A6M3IXI0_9ZZZZ